MDLSAAPKLNMFTSLKPKFHEKVQMQSSLHFWYALLAAILTFPTLYSRAVWYYPLSLPLSRSIPEAKMSFLGENTIELT